MNFESKSEKAMILGIESLENWEILSLLFGFNEKKSKRLMGDQRKWIALNPDNLDINSKQRVKIEALLEIHRRFGTENYKRDVQLCSTRTSRDYAKNLLESKFIEELYVIGLDQQNNLMATKKFKGTVGETVIPLRELVKFAICSNAANIIIAHNHPGGSLNPSRRDIEMTNATKKALSLHSIGIYDHIIVNFYGDTFSFAENGLI